MPTKAKSPKPNKRNAKMAAKKEQPEVIRISTPNKDNDGEFVSFFFLTTQNNRKVYELKYTVAPKTTNLERVKEKYVILANNAVEQIEKASLFNAVVETATTQSFVEKYGVDLL